MLRILEKLSIRTTIKNPSYNKYVLQRFVSEDRFKRESSETLASIQFEGYELLEKVVKSSGNSGRVYLPTSWIGSRVKIVRLTPKLADGTDDS